MAYASEEIINALKKGREAKGLSQRALSARYRRAAKPYFQDRKRAAPIYAFPA